MTTTLSQNINFNVNWSFTAVLFEKSRSLALDNKTVSAAINMAMVYLTAISAKSIWNSEKSHPGKPANIIV